MTKAKKGSTDKELLDYLAANPRCFHQDVLKEFRENKNQPKRPNDYRERFKRIEPK